MISVHLSCGYSWSFPSTSTILKCFIHCHDWFIKSFSTCFFFFFPLFISVFYIVQLMLLYEINPNVFFLQNIFKNYIMYNGQNTVCVCVCALAQAEQLVTRPSILLRCPLILALCPWPLTSADPCTWCCRPEGLGHCCVRIASPILTAAHSLPSERESLSANLKRGPGESFIHTNTAMRKRLGSHLNG